MLSIHNNLSAGAQNITGAYVIIMLVCRHLIVNNMHVYLEISCVIVNNAIMCKLVLFV